MIGNKLKFNQKHNIVEHTAIQSLPSGFVPWN